MARPTKFRKVDFFPEVNYFVPIGVKKVDLKEVVLKLEELEAIRLKDIDGLTQEECAKKMLVSRQTFQNIIDSARQKVAIALTQGMAINISGGNYITKNCVFKCLDCGELYPINSETDKFTCPSCNSSKVMCSKKANKLCGKFCNSN